VTLGNRPPIWRDRVIDHLPGTVETAICVAAKYLKFWPACSAARPLRFANVVMQNAMLPRMRSGLANSR
jgi:hypothetical protein